MYRTVHVFFGRNMLDINLLLTLCLFADCGLVTEGLSFTQHFVSDDVMSWYEADRACPILFHPGDGTIHMAANLTSQPQQIQVLRFLNEQESVWLDGYRFHLGCNDTMKTCEYITTQHIATNQELKSICISGDNITAEFDCKGSGKHVFNLTSIADHPKLLNLPEYVGGEDLEVNEVHLNGIITHCRLATKTPEGFKIGYENCGQKLKVLCQKHFLDNILEPKWLITMSLSGVSFIFSISICICLCFKRKKGTPTGASRRSNGFESLRHQAFEEIVLGSSL
ncbi:uncharacterized protein LOC128189997 isoform X2 [Crassostrea angulata]|uniref:uncharacterized protein LOC128189997 isoform X2 n=1 Tax=Magallana angulata TaxID=2784310 RepID=UPI0022B187A8|nr:uncharacterized protein LOC128189997 isoform X2 [Crassostrea angulata]